MKFRKSLIAAAVCACQMLSFVSVWANTATISADITDGSISVSGSLDTERAKTQLILRLKDSSGTDVLAEFTTSRFQGDEIVFEFEKIFLPWDLDSGSYTVEITGAELEKPIIQSYEHIGTDRVLEILTNIRDASDIGSEMKKYSHELALDMSDYDLLDQAGYVLFEDVMEALELDLPETHMGDENREKINTETEKLFGAYKNATCLALFESISDKDDASLWLNRYYKALGFDAENDKTEYSEKKITAYFEDVKNTDTFVQKLKDAKSLDTVEKVKAYVYESTLLSVIAEKRSSVVKDMMLEFTDLFDIDTKVLEKLSVSKQSACFTNITGTVFESFEAASDALADEIEKASGSSGKKPSGGGGGGGGGGGNVAVGNFASASKADGNKGDETANVFNDINSSHWAYDAVLELSKRGILNGKGAGIFAPEDSVTRGEFIKMITTAMALKNSGTETPFVDVAPDAWYAPYAAMAYKQGIVLGDNENRFNPDAKITREDMVTILYRALNVNAEGSALSFTDSGQISDYALVAVGYFSDKGIVNGMGDGRFAPKESATRAQAAKILYNIIMN
ncbi:MAG: S-layer homology domain-containing protein [Clostridia bacterium]|nr:S-layer homology domain-containing protein [Clostridia bacterium]